MTLNMSKVYLIAYLGSDIPYAIWLAIARHLIPDRIL